MASPPAGGRADRAADAATGDGDQHALDGAAARLGPRGRGPRRRRGGRRLARECATLVRAAEGAPTRSGIRPASRPRWSARARPARCRRTGSRRCCAARRGPAGHPIRAWHRLVAIDDVPDGMRATLRDRDGRRRAPFGVATWSPPTARTAWFAGCSASRWTNTWRRRRRAGRVPRDPLATAADLRYALYFVTTRARPGCSSRPAATIAGSTGRPPSEDARSSRARPGGLPTRSARLGIATSIPSSSASGRSTPRASGRALPSRPNLPRG